MPKRKRPAATRGGDYVVGYRKPPKHSQFPPGQSGNPAGRRKGVRNLKTDVMRTLAAPVKVKEGGRTKTRSTQEGALILLRDKVFRGDARALDGFFELALRFNSDIADIGPAQPLSADDQAILAAYVAEITAPTTTQARIQVTRRRRAKSPREASK